MRLALVKNCQFMFFTSRTLGRLLLAVRVTKLLNLSTNHVADLARGLQLFFMRALAASRIGKAPVQTCGDNRKNRAPLGADLIAYRYHIRKHLPRLEDVEYAVRRLPALQQCVIDHSDPSQ